MTSASCTYHKDVDFKFKGNISNNQQGINIFMHNCMLSARDVAMNNYSALVLSNNLSLDDVFELRSLQKKPGSIINTQLGLSIDAQKTAATKYLYFDNQRQTLTFDFNVATSHRLLTLEEMPQPDQSFFNFEMLDEKYARICYNYKHERFYLAINSTEDVVFAAGYTDYDDLNFNYIDETIFEYIFDSSGESLFLRKPLSGNRTKFLGVSGFDSNKLQLLSAFNASNYLLFNNFNFLVRSNAVQLNNKMNASWASYTTDDVNKLNINNETLLSDLPSNLLVVSQYANATPLQVPARPIVLKNQATQLGTFDKASYINQRNDNAGPINRDYTNIFAGNSQEKGDENIAINFTMLSNDFVAKADAYSSFKTSESLYPYDQLNVNDASLRTDGAYAGDSPYTSDQILALKNAAQGADGQYLCTWLSAGPNNASAEWVDRYYNNNKMSPMDAAKAVNATYGTYEDFVSAYLQQQSFAYDFFDKKSDVVFEPNQEYFYYRIGSNRIKNQLASYGDALVIDSLRWKDSNNQLFSDAYNANKVYELNGYNYDVVQNYDAINSNYAFTISFWLKCDDWTKLNAYQILGNLTNTGFALIKDPVVTPLIMVQSSSALNIYNSDFKQITQTLLPEPTLFVPRFDAIDDFGAISSSAVYKMHADGTLYDKYNFTNDGVIDSGTEINIWFDDSGSMNTTLLPLVTMRDALLKQALLPYFDNNSSIYDERVKVRLFSEYEIDPTELDQYPTERTMLMISAPSNSSATTRVINLVFQDESSPYNADSSTFNTSAQTPIYTYDVAKARNALVTAPYSYNAIIFQVNTGPNSYPGFRQFLQAVQNGTGVYAATGGLSDFNNIEYNYNVLAGSTPAFYTDLIVSSLESVGLITSTASTASSTKNIDMIQNNDSVYLLNSDETTVSHFNFVTETLSTFEITPGSKSILYGDYGVIGTVGTKSMPYGANTALYLYNDNQIVNYNYASNEQFVAFKSLSSASVINFIRDFDVDKHQNIYILNGDYKVVKYNNERILQYSITTLNSLSCINFAIASCYEYQGDAFIHTTIIASRDANDFIHLTKLDEQGNIIATAATNIKYSADATLNLTNAAYLQQKYQNRGNKLDFVVKLANKYNNRDLKTIVATIDLDEILPGIKHFALRLDGVQGNATILIDGKIADVANFGAAKYAAQQPLISNAISFGNTQFINGATLAQFLKQPAAYFASNATLMYPKIYAKALSDNDVRFITMQDYTISDLTFHLPCGMRNNVDVIKRMFAFGAPGMKSNNVSIIIKNSGINNDILKQSLKQQILSQVSQSMPATINILGVEFVDYE
jgi:hypothetical protein